MALADDFLPSFPYPSSPLLAWPLHSRADAAAALLACSPTCAAHAQGECPGGPVQHQWLSKFEHLRPCI
eukprot:scaffold114565_cov15-Tisochrysis_lutea.AAC.1